MIFKREGGGLALVVTGIFGAEGNMFLALRPPTLNVPDVR